MKRLIFILIVHLTSGTGQADETPAYIKDFDQLHTELERIFESPKPYCDSFKNYQKSTPSCNYRAICSRLTANRNQPYLYKNRLGGKIPNFALLRTEQLLEACFEKKVQESSNKEITPLYVFEPETNEAFQKIQRRNKRLSKKFLQCLRKKNESKKYIRIQEAALDLAVEDTPTILLFADQTVPSRSDIEADLREIEDHICNGRKICGKRLKRCRNEFVDMSLAMSQPLPSPFAGIPNTDDNSNTWKIANNNPFLVNRLLYSEEAAGSKRNIKRNQRNYQKRVTRAHKVFKEAQDGIVAVLKGKRTKENQKKIDEMIKRVKTARFKVPDIESYMEAPIMGCSAPNAFYDQIFHTFTLCPQILEFPDAALKSIITHELGHSVDPCTLTGNLMRLSGSKKDESQGGLSRLFLGDDKNHSYKPKYPGRDPDDTLMVDIFDNSELLAKELYKEPKFKLESAGIPTYEHPFTKTLDCLTSSESIAARKNDEEAIRKPLEKAIAQLKSVGATLENNPELEQLVRARDNLPKLMKEKGACSFIPGREDQSSQVQEAFSDWLAAEVAANDLKAVSGDRRHLYAFESFGPFIGTQCELSRPEIHSSALELAEKMGCLTTGSGLMDDLIAISGAKSMNADVHNTSSDRVNRIFLAHPEIASALGCQIPKELKHCE